jgi:putative hydroxymethylpyrimidine transport system substrate-binding protein
MRRPVAAVAVLLTALAVSACGEKTDRIQPRAADAETIGVELDGPPSIDDVGLYEARADGDFRRAGLNVEIHTPASPASALSAVESGQVQVALTSEPQLMLARDQGALVLGFGAVVQRPLTAILAVGARHPTSVAGLRGRTVGTGGLTYQRDFLRIILRRAHVPAASVRQIDLGSRLLAGMTSGRVAATLGGTINDEAIVLRRRRLHPTVIPVSTVGVPTYDQLVLATTESYFQAHNNELRRFVQALGRGYAAVRDDPAAAANTLTAAAPSLDPAVVRAGVSASLTSFLPRGGRPFGWQDQHEWNVFGRWMTDRHLIGGPRAWAAASTNQLLAGQGP